MLRANAFMLQTALFEQVFQGQAYAFADFRAFGNAFGGGFGFAFVVAEGKQGVDDVLAFVGNGIRANRPSETVWDTSLPRSSNTMRSAVFCRYRERRRGV